MLVAGKIPVISKFAGQKYDERLIILVVYFLSKLTEVSFSLQSKFELVVLLKGVNDAEQQQVRVSKLSEASYDTEVCMWCIQKQTLKPEKLQNTSSVSKH